MPASEEMADFSLSTPFPVQLVDVFPVKLAGQLYKVAPEVDTATLSPTASITGLTITEAGDTCQVELAGQIQFDSDMPPFSLEVMIVGIFRQVAPLPTGQSLGTLTGSVAAVLMLPYLRQEIHQLSVHLRLPPVILPVLSTQALPEVQTAENTSTEAGPPIRNPRNRPRRPSTQ